MELVKGMHYQLACQKYFELTHNVEDTPFSLSHPNQYFLESQKLLGGGGGGKELKREADASQRSQENSSSRGSSAAQEVADSEHVAEMTEDLNAFFEDV